MLGRRILVLLLILVGLGAFAAAVAPRDGGFQPTLPPPAGTQPAQEPGESPPAPPAPPPAPNAGGPPSTQEAAPSNRPDGDESARREPGEGASREPGEGASREPGEGASRESGEASSPDGGSAVQTATDGVVDAELPPPAGRSSTIRVRTGELVRLTVRADRPTTVRIEGRSGIQPAEPGTPARFSFIATAPGRYPIVRGQESEPMGTLVVTGAS